MMVPPMSARLAHFMNRFHSLSASRLDVARELMDALLERSIAALMLFAGGCMFTIVNLREP
jgi:hypothetical protein